MDKSRFKIALSMVWMDAQQKGKGNKKPKAGEWQRRNWRQKAKSWRGRGKGRVPRRIRRWNGIINGRPPTHPTSTNIFLFPGGSSQSTTTPYRHRHPQLPQISSLPQRQQVHSAKPNPTSTPPQASKPTTSTIFLPCSTSPHSLHKSCVRIPFST